MVVDQIRKGAVICILLICTWLSAAGHLETAGSFLGTETISDYNKAYLETSFDTSMKGFLILSGLKSGLAIIEGSEVGVGFNLELGDIVQSVYDYVDIAWKTALAGGTILLISQLVLQIVSLINHWCLAALFLLILAAYLLTMFSRNSGSIFLLVKHLTAFCAILTIALYLILPVSIRGASWLSGHITNPLIEEAHGGFSTMKNDLSPEALSRKFFDGAPQDDSLLSKLNVSKHYEDAKRHFSAMGSYLKLQAEQIAVWTIKLIAGYLFDCLIFPITFFLLVYLFTKVTLNYLLGMKLQLTHE